MAILVDNITIVTTQEGLQFKFQNLSFAPFGNWNSSVYYNALQFIIIIKQGMLCLAQAVSLHSHKIPKLKVIEKNEI